MTDEMKVQKLLRLYSRIGITSRVGQAFGCLLAVLGLAAHEWAIGAMGIAVAFFATTSAALAKQLIIIVNFLDSTKENEK